MWLCPFGTSTHPKQQQTFTPNKRKRKWNLKTMSWSSRTPLLSSLSLPWMNSMPTLKNSETNSNCCLKNQALLHARSKKSLSFRSRRNVTSFKPSVPLKESVWQFEIKGRSTLRYSCQVVNRQTTFRATAKHKQRDQGNHIPKASLCKEGRLTTEQRLHSSSVESPIFTEILNCIPDFILLRLIKF